ncbi:DNA helicase [Tanacetum coccineum]|uniref:DNA helicase n=1 Tax=Tanacetum coccineum TaxID=301880 RepID=A0ABQ5J2C9_9ASTR
MKTKRKLIPKSTHTHGDADGVRGNVGNRDLCDDVCGVDPSVSPKRHCVRVPTSVVDGGGLYHNVCDVHQSKRKFPHGDTQIIYTRKFQAVAFAIVRNAFRSKPALVSQECIPPSAIGRQPPCDPMSGVGISVGSVHTHFQDTMNVHHPHTLLIVRAASGSQQLSTPVRSPRVREVPNVNKRARARRDHTRRGSIVGDENSSSQVRASGPPVGYKHLGGCDYSCQHCGALFCVLQRDIVEGLIDLLDTHNALVQLFRTAREKFEDTNIPNFKLRLYNVIGAREYELPTGDMLGAIVYEAGPEADMDYDIVLEERSGHPQRVHKLHPSYMSLQFPLLFLYGEDGYQKEMKMVGSNGSSSQQKRLTMLAYYSYYLHDHANRYNYLSRTRRLFQQYVVTAFCVVEQNRIDFIREHQNDIRNEYLSGIYDAINRGDNDGSDCGSRLILPQSFTGGPRYMYSHYLDALAICRVHGNPSCFITFTCNVKWPEITDYMAQFPLLTTTDRADVVDRVFEMKIHQFVAYLRDSQPFGKVVAVLYTVEFQKRCLPHCHTLLWIDESVRIHPEGYRIVSELMMHGPCGLANPSATCIRAVDATMMRQGVELDNGELLFRSWTDALYNYMQRIVFKEKDKLDSLVVNPHKKTTLTEWLYYNEHNTYGRHLTYLNFPSEFVWYADGKYWRCRRMRNKSSVGRLTYVHPASGDLFYQRMLLCHQKGCQSFPGIRTINDIVYPTCRTACEALGLLQDDQEWEITLEEGALTATPAELRALLAHILAFCEVSDLKRLWQRTWRSMSEDIPYVSSILLNIPGLHTDDSELEDYVLYEFEGCLNHCSKSLTDFGLRLLPEHLMSVHRNRLLMEEKSYDRQLLAAERDQLLPKLNEKQLYICNLIMNACRNNQQELVFVYGHEGMGKTFI